MLTINLSQGDTDKRKLVLSDADGPIDLTQYAVSFVMTDGTNTSITIACEEQDSNDTGYNPWHEGGISIPFSKTNLAKEGYFKGQIFLTLANSRTTFPLGDYISVKIWESVNQT